MAKVIVEQTCDCFDRPMVLLTKKRGSISRREAYEAMEKEGLWGKYLQCLNFTEETPEELYDEGDEWMLYEPEAIWSRESEEQYNKGYDECMIEHMPETDWNKYHKCGICGGPAPADPYCPTEKWDSRICPHCGARMKNGNDLLLPEQRKNGGAV